MSSDSNRPPMVPGGSNFNAQLASMNIGAPAFVPNVQARPFVPNLGGPPVHAGYAGYGNYQMQGTSLWMCVLLVNEGS